MQSPPSSYHPEPSLPCLPEIHSTSNCHLSQLSWNLTNLHNTMFQVPTSPLHTQHLSYPSLTPLKEPTSHNSRTQHHQINPPNATPIMPPGHPNISKLSWIPKLLPYSLYLGTPHTVTTCPDCHQISLSPPCHQLAVCLAPPSPRAPDR